MRKDVEKLVAAALDPIVEKLVYAALDPNIERHLQQSSETFFMKEGVIYRKTIFEEPPRRFIFERLPYHYSGYQGFFVQELEVKAHLVPLPHQIRSAFYDEEQISRFIDDFFQYENIIILKKWSKYIKREFLNSLDSLYKVEIFLEYVRKCRDMGDAMGMRDTMK